MMLTPIVFVTIRVVAGRAVPAINWTHSHSKFYQQEIPSNESAHGASGTKSRYGEPNQVLMAEASRVLRNDGEIDEPDRTLPSPGFVTLGERSVCEVELLSS